MKAKFSIKGETKFQSLYDLVGEAEEKGYRTENEILYYLHDCYIADESGFEGNFSEWLDEIDE